VLRVRVWELGGRNASVLSGSSPRLPCAAAKKQNASQSEALQLLDFTVFVGGAGRIGTDLHGFAIARTHCESTTYSIASKTASADLLIGSDGASLPQSRRRRARCNGLAMNASPPDDGARTQKNTIQQWQRPEER